MNLKFIIVSAILSLLIVNKVFSATITISPTGTINDTNLIQTALNELHAGDKLILNGNFKHKRTLYLPSNFTWILNGSLTLGDNAVLDKVGWIAPGIDARRPTGISFSLFQIFPNPVSSNSSIEYTVPTTSSVSLKIYDMSGSEISTLVNEKKQNGYYKIEFYRKNLSAGTYLYRISVGDILETKKFVLK